MVVRAVWQIKHEGLGLSESSCCSLGVGSISIVRCCLCNAMPTDNPFCIKCGSEAANYCCLQCAPWAYYCHQSHTVINLFHVGEVWEVRRYNTRYIRGGGAGGAIIAQIYQCMWEQCSLYIQQAQFVYTEQPISNMLAVRN